jgi:hypothetical protein
MDKAFEEWWAETFKTEDTLLALLKPKFQEAFEAGYDVGYADYTQLDSWYG